MLIAEETDQQFEPRLSSARAWSWLSVALTILLLGAGLWYLVDEVGLGEIALAIKLARAEYLLLSVLAVLATLLAKSWRWQTLLSPLEPSAPMSTLFWALMLGQYVNLLVPLLRLGEVARVFAIGKWIEVGKARAFSTLMVEKILDLVMLAAMMFVLLSASVLPDILGKPSLAFGLFSVAALALFYLLAAQSDKVLSAMGTMKQRVPYGSGKRVLGLGMSSLEGLSALKDRTTSAKVLIQSALIAVLSLLTPWVLFPALNVPLGLAEATIVHVAVTLALVPPTTPGKLVIFDGTVALLLAKLGVEDGAVIAAYTIVFHLVVLLPPIGLGSVAASRTGWGWSKSVARVESGPAGTVR